MAGGSEVVICERVDADLPALVEVLVEQQPSSRYPVRWPLPFPIEEFIVRPGELVALVAELDGKVVGHVSVLDVPTSADSSTIDAAFTAMWSGALGRPVEELVVLTAFFTAARMRGLGVGAELHDAAVAAIRELGRGACLDVVVPTPAHGCYLRRGWQGLGRLVPAWLAAADPGARGDLEAIEAMVLR